MAIQRVASRVEKRGHHIPEDVIHRRYERGIKNLFEMRHESEDTKTLSMNAAKG